MMREAAASRRRHRAGGLEAVPWSGLLLLLLLFLVMTGCEPEAEPVANPALLSTESPFRYPLELWDAEESGETLLMVLVSDEGAVDSVYVLETSGRAAFDSAAVAGAHELRFSPGRRGERRVAMWTRLPVRFRRGDPGMERPNE